MTAAIESLYALAWPLGRAGEALEALARKADLLPSALSAPLPHIFLDSPGATNAGLTQWIDQLARQLGVEAEPVESAYADVDTLAQEAAPALLRLPPLAPEGEPRLLAVLSRGARQIVIIAPDFSLQQAKPQTIRDALCRTVEAPFAAAAEEVLRAAGIQENHLARARQAVVAEQLSDVRITAGWLLRLAPSASLWQHAQKARLFQPLVTIFVANILQQAFLILSWWLIGQSAFRGEFATLRMWAWALLVLSGIPFQMAMNSAEGQFATGLGGVFKQRLLYGILKLNPDETRHQGLGQFLGRVMEAEAVQLLAVGGGFAALIAVTQLITAAWVLASGAGGVLHAGVLGLWTLITLLCGWRYFAESRAWVEAYRAMTNDLVERMVGHRTRLAQEDRARWHVEEDAALDRYFQLSERFDRLGTILAAIPRAWIVAGLAGIAYAFVVQPADPSRLAVSLGGVLLALQSLTSISAGLQSVVAFTRAWGGVGPLLKAASRPPEPSSVVPNAAGAASPAGVKQPLLVANEIAFRYRDRGPYVLERCGLQIFPGDHLLLEGPSGGGKSTLAAVLAGLRAPESGLLMLWGYDRQSIGAEAWRHRVVVAPQFHENYVFTDTLAFNLLMGRRWPPTDQDLHEAEALCRELGLGDLVGRMPSGLQQIVGESGWQLSHGERSRLFIARALLQKADLVIMDESFGALDPENLYLALDCALRRAATLVVIAHP